ncbi:hypothetical protein JCM10213_004160 [Rhodosporidiobolus nylandii]
MSFSVLPPELKERIAFVVKEQDERYCRGKWRYRRSAEDWYGRGLLALSQVDKQTRELVLPLRYSVSRTFLSWLPVSAEQIIPQSFNLARLQFGHIESWSASDGAQVCRTIYLGVPVVYESDNGWPNALPAWRECAEQEGFDGADRGQLWRALRHALSYLDRLPLLRHISFDTPGCNSVKWYQLADNNTRLLFHNNAGGIRDVAGLPALARRITTWTFDELLGSEVVSLLTLDRDSPQTVSVSVNGGSYDNDARDLIEALRSCKSLKRLELKVSDSGTMYGPLFGSQWTRRRPGFAALRHLAFEFGFSFDDSVFPFLTSLPALEVLELNARDADLDDDGEPATSPATVHVKLPSGPSLPDIFPSLTSLRLERSTFPRALTTLAGIEAPNLRSATLVFYLSSEVEPGAVTYSVSPSLISSIETQNPLLHSLTLAPRGEILDPIPHQFDDFASTLSASNLTLSVQSPSGCVAFPGLWRKPAPKPSEPSEPSRPPTDEARELLGWATAELDRADRVGDDGTARLLRDSLKGIIELQSRLAEGYVSSRRALL